MNPLSTAINSLEGIDFDFKTTYMGKEITLKVISDKDRYTILHDDKTIGHIKIGEVRHTWYVVDSHYPAAYLVDAIGNIIEAQYKFQG